MTSPLTRYDFSLWYFEDDNPIATSISKILKEKGFCGYVEHQDQVAGRSVITSTTEIIQTSRVAILLLTARSVADQWCKRVVEWNLLHMIEQGRTRVIPVYVDITQEQLPLALRHLSGLEYHSEFFQQRLLKTLQKARQQGRPIRPSSANRAGFS